MATETTDYAAVLAFIRQAERRDCILADPALPELLRTHPGNDALHAGLARRLRRVPPDRSVAPVLSHSCRGLDRP